MSSDLVEAQKSTTVYDYLLMYRIPGLFLPNEESEFYLDRTGIYSSEEEAKKEIPSTLNHLDVKVFRIEKDLHHKLNSNNHYVVGDTGADMCYRNLQGFCSFSDAMEKADVFRDVGEIFHCRGLTDKKSKFFVMKPSPMP